MYGFKDFACGTQHPYEVLVPAGQRTDNTAGYSLDYKTYIGTCADFSQDCFFVGMRLFAPKPTAGNMVEMSFSVLDPSTFATTSSGASWQFDTVFCAINYQDPANADYYGFQCWDGYGPSTTLPYTNTKGNTVTAKTGLVDTIGVETNDWKVAQGNSGMECTDVYCEFEVLAYRPLVTDETANTIKDIKYEEGNGYTATGSYRVFSTYTTGAASAKGQAASFVNFNLNKRIYVPSGKKGDRAVDKP